MQTSPKVDERSIAIPRRVSKLKRAALFFRRLSLKVSPNPNEVPDPFEISAPLHADKADIENEHDLDIKAKGSGDTQNDEAKTPSLEGMPQESELDSKNIVKKARTSGVPELNTDYLALELDTRKSALELPTYDEAGHFGRAVASYSDTAYQNSRSTEYRSQGFGEESQISPISDAPTYAPSRGSSFRSGHVSVTSPLTSPEESSFPLAIKQDMETPSRQPNKITEQQSYDIVTLQDEQPTALHVEDLCNISRIVHTEWIRRTSGSATMPLSLLPFTPKAFLTKGLETLRQVLLGELPEAMEPLCALIHLAVACLYKKQEHRDMIAWRELLEDIMDWQYMLQYPLERKTFRDFMLTMMGPRSKAKQSTGGCAGLNMDYLENHLRDSVHQPRDSQCDPQEPLTARPFDAEDNPWEAGLARPRIRRGKVLSACFSLLDGT